ncbi:polysaccharide pyruvyl transferase family protein [Rhodococcus jostii]|uniref:polysaccharide pyruvyl transferase family protein n=1 Tax=Rhodococcus jostii TaxID=132919 RepID=UPI003652B215
MTQDDRTKILVLWADENSTNLGVQALAEGTRRLANLLAPGAEVSFRSYGGVNDRNLRLGARSIAAALVGKNPALREWIAKFDLVIDTGAGDSFADIYGVRRLAEMSALRCLMTKVGVPFVMGPQTIGPFERRLGRAIAARSLRGATAVIGRDSVSAKRAEQIYGGRIILGSDVAFLIEQPEVGPRHDVVLNVSGLLWEKNPHVDYMFYRESIYRLANAVLAQGRSLALLAHVVGTSDSDSDLHAVEEVRQYLGNDVIVLQPENVDSARSMLAGAQVVVASRMHAALNALSTGVPAMAWAYSRKFGPLLGDIGWPHLIDLRTANSSIVDETMVFLDRVANGDIDANGVRKRSVNQFENLKEQFRVGGDIL